MLFIAVIAIGISVWLFHWLMNNPAIAVAAIAAALAVASIAWFIRHRRKQTVRLYKQSLDATFVTAASAPSAAALNTIRQQQAGLPRTQYARQTIENIESEVYQAILDKVLDDGFIAPHRFCPKGNQRTHPQDMSIRYAAKGP